MADDDEQKDAAADPWASLESEGLPDLAGEFGFAADEGAESKAAASPADDTADADVESWLDEPAAADAGDAAEAGDSAVQIGTGESGIPSPSSVGGFDEDAEPEDGAAWGHAEAGSEWSATDDTEWNPPAEQGPEEGDGPIDADESFLAGAEVPEEETVTEDPVAAADTVFAAAAARPTAPTRSRPRPKRRKAGGIGQMLGVVLGGAMAIPITMAILIWGLQKDPFKVTELAWVQDYGGFLLPAKFRPGATKKSSTQPGGSPLDQLAGMKAADVDSPAPDVSPEPQPEEPVPLPLGPPEDAVATVDGTTDATPVSPPEPEPLDTSALDGAVAAASTALDAVLAIDDPQDEQRKKLVVKCYRSLAKMAEELVQIERTAADSGRPLGGPPEAVLSLHDRLATCPGVRNDLAGMSALWLQADSTKRGNDGIFLQLQFGKARHVGPYWCSEGTIREADSVRDVTVISRAEPAALRGDVLVVTGLVLDDDVIWAADVRPAAGAGGSSAQ